VVGFDKTLNNNFEFWQPGDTEMAVLQEDPPALVSSIFKLGFCFLCLALTKRNSVKSVHHIVFSTQLFE
jgi:hypothetical protein